ncbi:hypothetical protein Tco_1316288 [Tanacetum coccineum]
MAILKFANTHNMVGFLSKPIKSDGFEQIVDFLNAHPIKRDLQLKDAEGVDCLSNSTIFEQLSLMSPKTTAWNEFSSTMASAIICLATNQKFNFSKYIFESMMRLVHKELVAFGEAATTASRLRSRAGHMLRVESSGDEEDLGEDASKKGRRINAIDADEDIILVNVQDDYDNEMFDVDALNGEEVFVAGQNENVVEEVVNAAQVKSTTTTHILFFTNSKDKGKGIMIEDLMKPNEEEKFKSCLMRSAFKFTKANLIKKKDLQRSKTC